MNSTQPPTSTPRTDEALIDNADFYDEGYGKSSFVSEDFARTLETELSAATALLERCLTILPEGNYHIGTDIQQFLNRKP